MRGSPRFFKSETDSPAVRLSLLTECSFGRWLNSAPPSTRIWCSATLFRAAAGQICLLPDDDGMPRHMLAGVKALRFWDFCTIVSHLPPGRYRLDGKLQKDEISTFFLAWAYAQYNYNTRNSNSSSQDKILLVDQIDQLYEPNALAYCLGIARSLIDSPANELGPIDLAGTAVSLMTRAGADAEIVRGEQLVDRYPCIDVVGRSSSREPCLADIRWGDEDLPKVTIVGKGVCFDTGGLNAKSAQGMRQMKRDMGGAAIALGLALLIVQSELSVRLRLILPCAENSISSTSMRPGDVITTASGKSVEIGNTDAEGRLLLCDALTEACRDTPDLIIDIATLTAGARVALGPQIGALFSNDHELGNAIATVSLKAEDPLWQLPLWPAYRSWLDSPIADINSTSDKGMAGALVAALYLSEFVPTTIPWVHLDVMAWNPHAEPGRPAGAEPTGLRALYFFLKQRYPRRTF